MADRKVKRIGKLSFSISDVLKRGRYGKLFLGKYEESKAVAIKRLDKSETEVDLKTYLDTWGHPNIIHFVCFENNHLEFIFIATGLCAGTLEGLVNGSYIGPAVGDSRVVLKQVTTGLEYLHSLNIVHGDLKPTNVLISHPIGNISPLMKLTDFGLRHIRRNEANLQWYFQPAHTKGWMCYFDKENDKAFDLFPLGCLFFYTLFKGVHPFGETKEMRIDHISTRKPIILPSEKQLQTIGLPVWKLINKMVDYNSEQRPTASQILAHNYFCFKRFLCLTEESGQNLIHPKSVSTPSTSTARLPSGEAPTKVMRTEHLQQPPVNSCSNSAQRQVIFPGNHHLDDGHAEERWSVPPLMPITETVHRVLENPRTLPLDLRNGADAIGPFTTTIESRCTHYPSSPPPPIRSSFKAYRFACSSEQPPTLTNLAAHPSPQSSCEIPKDIKPLVTNHSVASVHTCSGVSPIDMVPQLNDDAGQRSSTPLLQEGNARQGGESAASIPNSAEIPSPNTQQEELRPVLIMVSSSSKQQKMAQVAKKSTSKQCLKQTKEVNLPESSENSDLESESDEDDITFIGEVINTPIDQNQPTRIEDKKIERGIKDAADNQKVSSTNLKQKATDVTLPLNVSSSQCSTTSKSNSGSLTASDTQKYPNPFGATGVEVDSFHGSSSSCSSIVSENPSHVPGEIEAAFSLQPGDKRKKSNLEEEANVVRESSRAKSIPLSPIDFSHQLSPMQKTVTFAELCGCRDFSDTQMIRFRKLALDVEVDLNYINSEGLAPLLSICLNQKSNRLYECIEILLRRPDLNINVRKNGRNANALTLVCRCYSGDRLVDIIKLLLDHKIKADTKNKNDETALMGLCINYNKDNIIDILRLLLKQPTVLKNLNAVSKDLGWNGLVLLCNHFSRKNLVDVARFLLENGIQIDTEYNKNDNALITICTKYKCDSLIDVARLLIQHKIDVNWTNPVSGENALIALCKNYNGSYLMNIIQVLLKSGIDVNTKNLDGQNCLFALAEKQFYNRDFYAIIKLLIENKIDLNLENENGQNILIYLSDYHDGGKIKLYIAELLIQNGTNVNTQTKTGYNILLSLVKSENLPTPKEQRNLIQTIQLVIKKGINVNQKNEEGMNALHLLCKFYRGTNIAEVVRILNATNIESEAIDNNGNTPEQYLRQRKFRNKGDIIKMLTND